MLGTVNLTMFSSGKQQAIDEHGNIWHIDGWIDADGDEIPINYPADWDLVDYVTAWAWVNGEGSKQVWTVFRPDDFNGEIVRTDN